MLAERGVYQFCHSWESIDQASDRSSEATFAHRLALGDQSESSSEAQQRAARRDGVMDKLVHKGPCGPKDLAYWSSTAKRNWATPMFCRILLLGFALCAAEAAGVPPDPPPTRMPIVDLSKVEVRATRVSDSFYVLEGQGGTISVLTGPDGVLMVDSQFAPLTDKIIAAIRQFSEQPIRFLINTHVHADHTGGNENLAKIGTLIFSRDQLRARLAHPSPGSFGRAAPPAPAKALPVVTYDGPVTLHVNGEDVQLIPIRAAHTDGDTLVRFPREDVLAVGDYYRSVGYPFVDTFNGGTLDGLLAGLAVTIDLAGPNTKIIPGHGPIVDRKAIIAQRDFVLAMRDRMLPLISKGMTFDQVLAANLTANSGIPVPDGAYPAEQFIWWMYVELTEAQRSGRDSNQPASRD
jgi:glyoxylase-like metal-dependent hydrolase (beta-lactamase superfamily II)